MFLFLSLAIEAMDIGGVDFPNGEISFADRVIGYNPCSGVEAPYNDPKKALGPPDYDANIEEKPGATVAFDVTLGNAKETCECGSLVLEFVDNALVDVPGNDLYIFEVGPSVEATEVFISTDGQEWIDLGRIEGSDTMRGIDINEKVSPGQEFHFVKLCDYPDGETSPSPAPGPDIDAVGAIGTIAVLSGSEAINDSTISSPGPDQVEPTTTIPSSAPGGQSACGFNLGSGIFQKWTQMGGQGSFLGCPTTNEMEARTSQNGTTGLYTEFGGGDGGYIIWHGNGPSYGKSFEVHGCIYKLYKSMGGTTSWLGFPISDEYDVAGGRRSDFENGYILWDGQTRVCQAYSNAGKPQTPTVIASQPPTSTTSPATQPSSTTSQPEELDLTGVWSCDDGGTYYIRQLGNTIWWFGESSVNPGRWSNAAKGTIIRNEISLDWSDVPKGCNLVSGVLALNVLSKDKLTATKKTGGFGGSTWTRTASTACPDSMPTSNGSMTSDLIPTTTSSSSTTITSLNQNTLNPWDTPHGQACFESWIRESMSRMNAYNGDEEFNARKPWSINKYGLLQAKGIGSVGAPEDFHDHNYNRYWWIWDHYNAPSSTGWEDNNWNGAQVPPIREYVNKCISQGG